MCDCNESPFTKLRESWSRHYQNEMRGQCNCCCQNQNGHAKVKGKFGVAYIIETPNRKCKPCGWEVEFNDTPSQIENNCKKMMTWITCPPLGECQNNHTNFCCGSTAPKEVLNAAHNMCCKSGDTNMCSCCKDKSRTSGGDCCCKTPQQTCNCSKKVNQKQCCSNCRAMNGQQAYLNSKNKNTCCILRSNDTPRCCCSVRNDEDECRCCKNTAKPKCCCERDSQSSLEESTICDCQKMVKRKKNKECDCQCNCANCKCSGSTKMQPKHREHKNVNKTKSNNRTSSQKMDHKQSKNLHSHESKTEKQKDQKIQRSPYTMSATLPKKGPDKEDFFEGRTEQKTETEIRNMDYENENPEENQSEIEKYVIENHQNKDIEQAISMSENTIIQVSDEREVNPSSLQEDKTVNEDDDDEQISDEKIENETLENYETNQPQQEPTFPVKPPRKKISRRNILKKIKEKHKKEMEAIHSKYPKQKSSLLDEKAENQTLDNYKANQEKQPQGPTIPVKPPRKRIKRGNLLKKIKEEHKKEMEAIHPKSHKQEISFLDTTYLLDGTIENQTLDNYKGNQEKQPQQEPTVPIKPPRKRIKRGNLLQKIKEEHKKEMEAIHPKSHKKEISSLDTTYLLDGTIEIQTLGNYNGNQEKQPQQGPTVPIKPPRKRIKRGNLLQKIKEEHKKEMEAIHPKSPIQETSSLV